MLLSSSFDSLQKVACPTDTVSTITGLVKNPQEVWKINAYWRKPSISGHPYIRELRTTRPALDLQRNTLSSSLVVRATEGATTTQIIQTIVALSRHSRRILLFFVKSRCLPLFVKRLSTPFAPTALNCRSFSQVVSAGRLLEAFPVS